MDKGPVFKTQILKLAIPIRHPLSGYKLLKGGDDVAVEFGVRRSTSPPDGVWDARFFGTCDRSEPGLAESAPGDDGQSVVDAMALTTALWAGGFLHDFKKAQKNNHGKQTCQKQP